VAGQLPQHPPRLVVGVQQLHLALQVHAPWSGTAESARRGRSCPCSRH
jgi:hypothetical protein